MKRGSWTGLQLRRGLAQRLGVQRPRDCPGRVLFVGHCYYNTWYLSRSLRKLGWRADTLHFLVQGTRQDFYHGHDFVFESGFSPTAAQLRFFLLALVRYDVFHFTGSRGLRFFVNEGSGPISKLPDRWEIRLLRRLGKKIVYSNNGCLDGALKSSFGRWGPHSVCSICRLRDNPAMCSDELNTAWGKARNELSDFQCLTVGNRVDFNLAPSVHEVPEFYCLDPDFWRPDLEIPAQFRLPSSEDTVRIYHAVGNYKERTTDDGVNIKCTHIFVPLVERLKAEGHKVELVFCHGVRNEDVRYYQAQSDIVVDMLTFGAFGANVREALMLGKPVVCFIRPEWLEGMRHEIPGYANELPVVSATPETAYDAIKALVVDRERRLEIGRLGRAFALRWHSAEAGGRRLSEIYSGLLAGKDMNLPLGFERNYPQPGPGPTPSSAMVQSPSRSIR